MPDNINTQPIWYADPSLEDLGGNLNLRDLDGLGPINPETDTSAAAYNALAQTASSLAWTSDFCVMKLTCRDSDGYAPLASSYRGHNGVGTAFAPDLARLGDGYFSVTFDSTYTDRFSQSSAIDLDHCFGTVSGATAAFITAVRTNAYTFTVHVWDAAGAHVTNKELSLRFVKK